MGARMGCRRCRKGWRRDTRLKLHVALADLTNNLGLTAELSFNRCSLLEKFSANASKVPCFRLRQWLILWEQDGTKESH